MSSLELGQFGKEINFDIIITIDNNQYPCHNERSKVNAQAQSGTGDVITAEIEDNQDGIYTASFMPSQPGDVEVIVTINGVLQMMQWIKYFYIMNFGQWTVCSINL